MNITFKELINPLTNDLTAMDEQVKMSEDPIPTSGNHSWLICGSKGKGKSSLLLRSILSKKSPYCCNKAFDMVFLCSQSARKDDKFNDLIEGLEEEGHFYDTFNEGILEEILEEITDFNNQYKRDVEEFKMNQSNGKKGYYSRIVGKTKEGKDIIQKIYKERLLPRHLLNLDDCINLLPRSTQNSKISDLYTNHRHYKLSIITTTQVYKKLNTTIRRNSDLLSLFRTENFSEYESIRDDWSFDKKRFDSIWDFATDKPNSFLHIVVTGVRPVFFKKFNKIIEE